eukprot:UN22590
MVPRNEYSHAVVTWMLPIFSEHKVSILSFPLSCRSFT